MLSFSCNNPTPRFQYKIAESPIPSAEEESSSEDEEDGPRKPKIDPDDPVARESNPKIFLEVDLEVAIIP